mmetsp:Transcript_9267/g.25062  ORF Transcript_9267/g.25062 Transcript_9267/m.25062 type:complete len:219 (-) Transcript_9267:360-1016(-)
MGCPHSASFALLRAFAFVQIVEKEQGEKKAMRRKNAVPAAPLLEREREASSLGLCNDHGCCVGRCTPSRAPLVLSRFRFPLSIPLSFFLVSRHLFVADPVDDAKERGAVSHHPQPWYGAADDRQKRGPIVRRCMKPVTASSPLHPEFSVLCTNTQCTGRVVFASRHSRVREHARWLLFCQLQIFLLLHQRCHYIIPFLDVRFHRRQHAVLVHNRVGKS